MEIFPPITNFIKSKEEDNVAKIRLHDLEKLIKNKEIKGDLLFTDSNINAIFGHEAADDESVVRLKEYYVKNIYYEKITSDLKLRILVGHKGIGKSAMFRIAAQEDEDNNILPISIKPDDVADLKKETPEFLDNIRVWKDGLKNLISKKILESLGVENEIDNAILNNIKKFGGQILEFVNDTINHENISLKPTREKIRRKYFSSKRVNVYIDDLDRGWKGRSEDIAMVSALMNAVRDISNEDEGVHFKIALRSDVYYLFRTSDESTDKVGGSVVWLTWTNHEILALLVKRIETFFGRHVDENVLFDMQQSKLANYLDPIMDPVFRGAGHWADAPIHRVLMSLIRRRPRDLVKLCSLAAQNAYVRKSNIIGTDDWETAFLTYSNDRLLDTDIEYKSELPELMRLMLGMKPSVKKSKAKDSYQFSTDELLNKIESISQRGKFTFSNGKVASPQELAHFLYKINFLTGRRKLADGKIVRKYFEEHNYLIQGYVDFGFSWEVHPAFRWALQPDDPKNIYQRLELLDFEK